MSMGATQHHLGLWKEERTRFTNQLKDLRADELPLRIAPASNSIGFLIRHMADVELLFAKNVFGAPDVKVTAKTVIAGRDTGEWTDLDELLEYAGLAAEKLEAIIAQQSATDWEDTITTKEFGTKSKAEALGRIVSHTAYHAGQMALIRKYANH